MLFRFALKRYLTLPAAFVTVVVCLLLLTPTLDITAQVLQSNLTPTPTTEFDPGFGAQPTEEPTEVPERITATEVLDPTEVVAEVIEPGTITLNKGACDDSAFDPATASGLDAFLDACLSPDGEFEFSVSDGAGFSATGWTSLGTVSFEVPATTISIMETIPAGWGDPAVFCWSNLLPTPAPAPFIGNGPTWDVQSGEAVECWWFNISVPPDQLHTIQIAKYECAADVDLASDFWTLATACDDRMEGVNFQLITEAETINGSTDANGAIEWVDVDLGASGIIQIDEEIPGGYGEPVVWCVSFPEAAADAQDFDFFAVASSDGTVNVQPELQQPFMFSCLYFNQAITGGSGDLVDPSSIEDGEGATVTVVKFLCPLGVPEDTTLDQYVVICPEFFEGIEFTLEHDDGVFPGVTGDDGQVEWPNVPAGEMEIQETIPEGFKEPIAFCISFDGEQELENGQVTTTGGVIPLSITDEATEVVCYVFNIQDPEATNTITLNKYRCPLGAPYEDFGSDIFDYCTEPFPDIDFSLYSSGPTDNQATGASGDIVWTGLPAGEFTIQEFFTPGYEDLIVYCEWVNAPEGVAIPAGRILMPTSNGMFTLNLPGTGYAIDCGVFNLPRYQSRIVVNKLLCPLGVDLVLTDDHDINDIMLSCPTMGDGIEFTLDNAHGSSTQAIADGGTFWDGMPHGPFTLSEEIPAGYVEPVWYCSINPFDENGDLLGHDGWILQDAPDGVLSSSIDSELGEIFACWVFNVPDIPEENTLVIVKTACDEGTSTDETVEWYVDNCPTSLDGVEFTVSSDIGIAVQETMGGTVQFDGLPAGTTGIQETIPDGYGAPIVFCEVDGVIEQFPAATGYWQVEFADNGDSEHTTCFVFNIPGEPGSITLEKWTCPPGYDLHAMGANPLADCTEATNGVQFQFGLAAEDSLAELQTTGDILDGEVVFDNLAPDTYKAVELVPDGIESVFVLECTGHIMGVLQPYPLETGNVLEIDLDAGEHLVCYWFNVPEDEGGDLTLIKYTCTTETFVSDVDCQVEENGKTFDLFYWSGTWDLVDTETTDEFGRIQWSGLADGEYWFEEHDGEWCHIDSDLLDEDGPWVVVPEGQETIVHVYNCDGTPGDPGDTPTKYPNTGVPPASEGSGTSSELPAIGGLLGLTIIRRRLVAGIGLPLLESAVLGRAVLAQDAPVIEPGDGTPAAGTPTSWASPEREKRAREERFLPSSGLQRSGWMRQSRSSKPCRASCSNLAMRSMSPGTRNRPGSEKSTTC